MLVRNKIFFNPKFHPKACVNCAKANLATKQRFFVTKNDNHFFFKVLLPLLTSNPFYPFFSSRNSRITQQIKLKTAQNKLVFQAKNLPQLWNLPQAALSTLIIFSMYGLGWPNAKVLRHYLPKYRVNLGDSGGNRGDGERGAWPNPKVLTNLLPKYRTTFYLPKVTKNCTLEKLLQKLRKSGGGGSGQFWKKLILKLHFLWRSSLPYLINKCMTMCL